jgi:hypothetical protein
MYQHIQLWSVSCVFSNATGVLEPRHPDSPCNYRHHPLKLRHSHVSIDLHFLSPVVTNPDPCMGALSSLFTRETCFGLAHHSSSRLQQHSANTCTSTCPPSPTYILRSRCSNFPSSSQRSKSHLAVSHQRHHSSSTASQRRTSKVKISALVGLHSLHLAH